MASKSPVLEVPEHVLNYLREQPTLTLATASPAGVPHATTLIYVNVGQPPASIELNDLRIRTSPEQTQIVAVLANTGKRNVRTKGTMTVVGADGKPVAQVPVPDVPVLPESEREVAIVAFEAAKPLPPGEYRIEVRFDVGMAALVVGETTLKVSR